MQLYSRVVCKKNYTLAAFRRIELMPARGRGATGLSKLRRQTSYEQICKKIAKQHRTREIAGKRLNGPKLFAIFDEINTRVFKEMPQ
jgi:hypothetical protein